MAQLSNKHMAFVDAYFKHKCNATAAYSDAYPNASEDTCGVNGTKLLGNTSIKEEIERRQAIIRAKHEITQEELIEITKRIMIANETNFPPASLKAVEVLAKLTGLNSPDKKDITSGGEKIQINIDLGQDKDNETN